MKTGLGLVVLAAACGGGGSSNPSLSELGQEVGAVICPRLFECCSTEELAAEWEGFNPPIDSVEDCQEFYATFVQGFLGQQYEASVESGRMVYHADRMGACLDTMSANSCAEFAEAYEADLTAACADPFDGQQAASAPCAHDEECASNYCQGADIDTEGTCATKPGNGQACDDFVCADGYYCDFGGSGSSCVAVLSAGSECWSDDECVTGNCDGSTSTDPGSCSASYTCDGV